MFVLIGGGGHAKVILEMLRESNEKILGVLDDDPLKKDVIGIPVLGKISKVHSLLKHYRQELRLIISVGNNNIREKIVSELKSLRPIYGKVIHPSAIISSSCFIDEGTVVMPNAVINASAKVGKHNIINTSSVVEHDCILNDYVHVSPGAHLSGNVKVGKNTHIGVGANIIQNIYIGSDSIIGGGSIVVSSIPNSVLAVGNPAKVKKKLNSNKHKEGLLMAEKRIYLSPPHMTGDEKKYINEAFETNWIAPLGPNVDHFEKELASYVGIEDAVAVSSGTAAIHLSLILTGIKPGDKVFCPSLTFVATANPIIYMGAVPVFIDSEPETWNISPQALLSALKKAEKNNTLPKAVLVVNLYGQSSKMKEILQICDSYDIPVIEDAAESLGSTYNGIKTGTFGKFGIYSFNGNKIITTSGGGMLVSKDGEALKKARFLAAQARDPAPYYQHSKIGYNYRMSNILAGIGRAQLAHLEKRIEEKRAVFKRYKDALSHIEGLNFMPELENTYSNRWLTTATINNQKLKITPTEVIEALEKENIEARHIWKPLHTQPVFKGCEYFSHTEDLSISERLYETGICLPSGTSMTVYEQERVIKLLLSMLE
ncbi:NeuD/PglB/VioB family sugar acetyltransferase [Cytobacillus oceanisediminis]|jgi:pyridoxal phosphate-dependent aminotransferase EpsN|nr:NeuD/PglB/VioB family sugar acetyltransferase [Cytobacillus oceanisediminis]